ncbi:GAP family protein [Paeniglutamicibacter sp. NPDC012692]|uniref:GAP family protein n=1 Tax=Paeniglutamicibacter sp. NPDC012692 TaxID=3364388 RepID=UPI003686D6CE
MMLGTTGLLLTLGLLALIDATSIGTLVIPLWLVLRSTGRRNLSAAVLYLGVVATFYLLVGLFILGGASRLKEAVAGDLFNAPALRWAALVAGAGMLAWALLYKPAKPDMAGTGSTRATVPGAAPLNGSAPAAGETSHPAVVAHDPGRTDPAEGRWYGRIDRALSTRWGVVVLGLSAGLLELPTMLPYLGAIGLLTESGHPVPTQIGLLVAYCLVMIVPGLAVIGLRAVAGARMQHIFEATSRWLARVSGESLAWVVGIVGFLMVRSSLVFLFPDAGWNPFT